MYIKFNNIRINMHFALNNIVTDFGDLLGTRRQTNGASSNLRAVFGGGTGSRGTWEDEIDYITIASTGNASDFGDLRYGRFSAGSSSSNHGGLN